MIIFLTQAAGITLGQAARLPVSTPPGLSLRFNGNGFGDIDRVKIRIDNPAVPADIGASDFTIEFWMKASLADNPGIARCNVNDGWITGNILLDRDIYGAGDYGDFVAQVDGTVGEVLSALGRAGLTTNTLVIFTSDNGPECVEIDPGAYDRIRRHNHWSMDGLRGVKRDVWEGGHRVPFVARWPGHIPAGRVCCARWMRLSGRGA